MNSPYALTFEERPDYLFALVKAEHVDESTARAYLTDIAGRCRRTHYGRLMIYRDIPDVLHGGALFFVAAEFQSLLQNVRVAFVNPYVQNGDDLEFGNIVSSNRGGEYHTFATELEAENWLIQDGR
jgi:hypothetical protein